MPVSSTLPKEVELFLKDKPAASVALFRYFHEYITTISTNGLDVTKTTIAFGKKRRFCYIYQFGKDFISGVLRLDEEHDDPEIFFKTGKVSGKTYVHHFRLYEKKDLSKVLKKYLKMAAERV